MKTRKQYLDSGCTHSEYWSQFVTEGHKTTVINRIGLDRLINSKDKHLNDIPLKEWDRITAPFGTTDKMKEAGDYLTLSGTVCIAKETARQIIREIKEES